MTAPCEKIIDYLYWEEATKKFSHQFSTEIIRDLFFVAANPELGIEEVASQLYPSYPQTEGNERKVSFIKLAGSFSGRAIISHLRSKFDKLGIPSKYKLLDRSRIQTTIFDSTNLAGPTS